MTLDITQAKSEFLKSQFQETINTCNQILARDANSIEALKLIAKSFLATKNIEDARLYLNKALDLNPDDYEVIKDLGNTYQALGEIETAKNYYLKAIEINSSYAPALTNLGNLELNSGNTQQAIPLLIKATESDPSLAPAWSNLANGHVQLGQTKEAEMACRKAIELNPNLFKSHFLLANILTSQNKLQEAEIASRKAIKLKPNLFNYHFLLSNILIAQKRLQEAEQPLRKTIELKPDFGEAYLNLGAILKGQGKLNQSENIIRKAIEFNPNNFNSYMLQANILLDQKKLNKSILYMQKAIELEPDNAEAHAKLGIIFRDLGKSKEAELSLRKAIGLNPDFAMAYRDLASILMESGKTIESMKYLEKAFKLYPESEKISYNIAYTYYLQNEYNSAIRYLVNKKSIQCQTLYLGCLLGMDKIDEFYQVYNDLKNNKISNPAIGALVDHVNEIYDNKIESTFCNSTIEYVLIDKVTEDYFSDESINEVINYLKSNEKKVKYQSLLTNGSQSSGNLFKLDYPFIKKLRTVIEHKIDIYKKRFIDSKEGLIENWPKDYDLNAWAVVMRKGGFLKPHNHTYGWISGSFYIKMPKLENKSNDGDLAFTYKDPNLPSKNKKFKTFIQKIETRDIIIFPSSLFHYTIPFDSEEERICFVFDLIPKT